MFTVASHIMRKVLHSEEAKRYWKMVNVPQEISRRPLPRRRIVPSPPTPLAVLDNLWKIRTFLSCKVFFSAILYSQARRLRDLAHDPKISLDCTSVAYASPIRPSDSLASPQIYRRFTQAFHWLVLGVARHDNRRCYERPPIPCVQRCL